MEADVVFNDICNTYFYVFRFYLFESYVVVVFFLAFLAVGKYLSLVEIR